MPDTRTCPSCGAAVPSGFPEGLCPRCLIEAGMKSRPSDPAHAPTQRSPASGGFVPPSPDELAARFPQLEILELLGKGGMGAVYKARQRGLDRLVAVKILPPDVNGDPAFAERFTREARALARLSHPHIVAVHDFGEADGLYYFVMEYVDGTNLRQAIHARSLAPADALAIVPQICDALQFAHDEGIIHRDIKPENILIDKRGRVKIADFGLAKLLTSAAPEGEEPAALPLHTLTATHQVMGTLRYMAPEQMEGAKQIDHRADIYSLGVVFYELLTGELPLGRFAPPSKKVEIDVRLDEVVLRALEKEPEQRYQHASDLGTEVELVRTSERMHRPAPIAAAPDDVVRRRYTVINLVLITLATALLCGLQAGYLSGAEWYFKKELPYQYLNVWWILTVGLASLGLAKWWYLLAKDPCTPRSLADFQRVFQTPDPRAKKLWRPLGVLLAGWAAATGLAIALTDRDAIHTIVFSAPFVLGPYVLMAALWRAYGPSASASLKSPVYRDQHASEVESQIKSLRTYADAASSAATRPPSAENRESESSRSTEAARGLLVSPSYGLFAVGILNWVSIAVPVYLILNEVQDSPVSRRYLIAVIGELAISGAFLALVASKMRALEAYRFCVMGAALPMVSALVHLIFLLSGLGLLTPGHFVGPPIGLWAMIVLSRRDVALAFHAREPARRPHRREPEPDATALPQMLAVAIGLVLGLLCATIGLLLVPAAFLMADAGSGPFWGWMGGAFGCLAGGLGSLVGSWNAYRQLRGQIDWMHAPRWSGLDSAMLAYGGFGLALLATPLALHLAGTLGPAGSALAKAMFHGAWLLGSLMMFQSALFLLLRWPFLAAAGQSPARGAIAGTAAAVILGGAFSASALLLPGRPEPIVYTFFGDTGFVEGPDGPMLGDRLARELGIPPGQRREADRIFQRYYQEFVSLERRLTRHTRDENGHVHITIQPFADESFALVQRLAAELGGIIDQRVAPLAPEKGKIHTRLGLFRHAGEATVTAELWKDKQFSGQAGDTHFMKESIEWIDGSSSGGRGSSGRSPEAFPEEYRLFWVEPTMATGAPRDSKPGDVQLEGIEHLELPHAKGAAPSERIIHYATPFASPPYLTFPDGLHGGYEVIRETAESFTLRRTNSLLEATADLKVGEVQTGTALVPLDPEARLKWKAQGRQAP